MSSSDGHQTRVPTPLLFAPLLAIVLIPAAIFVLTSYSQLDRTLDRIADPVVSKTVEVIDSTTTTLDDADARSSFFAKARIALERDIVLHRHERASAALATRTWMRFMSLMFGSVLVVIGCAFVLARVDAPRTDGRIRWRDISVSLATSSPGLFLVLFGCCLIAIPNVAKQSIEIHETSTYVQKSHDEPPPTTVELRMPQYPHFEQEDEVGRESD